MENRSLYKEGGEKVKEVYKLYVPKGVSVKNALEFIEEMGIDNNGGDPIGYSEKSEEYKNPITVTIEVERGHIFEN